MSAKPELTNNQQRANTVDWQAVRGPLDGKRMSARSTAALLDNPGCSRRAVLDTSGIDLAKLASNLGHPVPFGQSPFALGQGNRFEARVKDDNYAELVWVLRELGVDLPDQPQSAEIRQGPNEVRVEQTRTILAAVARGDADAPNVVDKAMTTLNVGRGVVYLEQDAMAFRHGDQLHICEIKGFPLIDGTAEPHKVGAAARQSAVYLASIQDTLAGLGLDETVVSPEVVLVCPKNYTIRPTACFINVERELRALRRQLSKREAVADEVAELDLPTPPVVEPGKELAQDEVADYGRRLVEALPYRYEPECIGRCDLSRLCRQEAREVDAPCQLGGEASNLLAGVDSIAQARALADDDQLPPEDAEVAEALQRARQAYAALAPGPRNIADADEEIDWSQL